MTDQLWKWVEGRGWVPKHWDVKPIKTSDQPVTLRGVCENCVRFRGCEREYMWSPEGCRDWEPGFDPQGLAEIPEATLRRNVTRITKAIRNFSSWQFSCAEDHALALNAILGSVFTCLVFALENAFSDPEIAKALEDQLTVLKERVKNPAGVAADIRRHFVEQSGHSIWQYKGHSVEQSGHSVEQSGHSVEEEQSDE